MAVAHTTDADAVLEYRRGEFAISTDRERLSLDVVHDFLTNCYWAKGVPRDVVERSIQGALCFGIYDANGGQVGFARVISDFATIAYVGDVFVLETHRGLGLGKWLMQCITLHPALQNLRRWILTTRDAHGLYSQIGFTPVQFPERYMELYRADVYETPRKTI
ncbi:MAG TPA: GNAT family N-acetyltransferase [Candidatus Sulfotelmatobacter sp.]|jgi:GNAT superfamily N-acetyltransferase|nr:GNAT family N-acetyltransferase [Candidatus Sulfotelmatobacter sp.]